MRHVLPRRTAGMDHAHLVRLIADERAATARRIRMETPPPEAACLDEIEAILRADADWGADTLDAIVNVLIAYGRLDGAWDEEPMEPDDEREAAIGRDRADDLAYARSLGH